MALAAIRPFKYRAADPELADLRQRIRATRLPVKETVADFSQGVPLAAEKAYPNLIHFNRPPKGGRFAAWEQPKLLSEELRAGFRSLR